MVVKWLLLALSVAGLCGGVLIGDSELAVLEGLTEADVSNEDNAAAFAAATPCNDIQLAACQGKFNEDLGIKGNVDWQNPAGLSTAILQIYEQQGPAGFKKICRARVDFQQCLGSSYAACMDYRYFVHKGYSVQNAIYYPAKFRSLSFQCSAGAFPVLNHWACDLQTLVSSAYSVRRCAAAFEAAPSNLKCFAALTYLECVSKPYKDCSVDLFWATCEYNRVGIATWLPYCPLYCDAQQGPVVGAALDPAKEEAAKVASLESPAEVGKDGLDHPLKDFDFFGDKAAPKEL